jgi:plastocyanin
MRKRLLSSLVLGAALAAFLAFPAIAADNAVTVKNFAFSPADLTISPGDSVTFSYDGKDGGGFAPHNVAFADGTKLSANANGSPSGAFTKSRTFTSAGVYTYICTQHTFMTGKVTVKAPGGSTDTTKPAVTSLSSKRVKLCKSSVKHCKRFARKLSFRLSEAATAKFTVTKAGAKKASKSFSKKLKAGKTSVQFSQSGLKAGRYTVSIVAKDTAGNVAGARKVKFTI